MDINVNGSATNGHGLSNVRIQGQTPAASMNRRLSNGQGHVNGQCAQDCQRPPPNPLNVLHQQGNHGVTGAERHQLIPTNSFRAQEQRVPPYDQNMKLPDSPPETDSGAASAGSPSCSDRSPFSPEYQHYHPMHGGQQNMRSAAGPADSQTGVLLNVHDLDDLTQTIVNDYILPMENNVNNGHVTNPAYYTNQTSHNEHQLSPPNYNTPFAAQPSVHNGFLSQDNETMSRKRLRIDPSLFVKPEPSTPPLGLIPDDLMYEDGMGQQSIKFFEFQKEQWHTLCDITGRELLPLGFHVVADKGFNFSHFDTSFVNQKKNHFQISAHIEVRDRLPPKFVRIPGEHGVLRPIMEFQLDFYGVKTEMLSSTVQIKQSQTDRKPIPYEPIKLDLPPSRVTKVTVARLHFSETTMNNQRKNNRPNPDQKYLYLVVALNAVVSPSERYTVVAFNSDKVIVRASNPGQFDTGEGEVHWQRGQNGSSIYHPGPVGIGTDKPTSTLTVAGDIQCTGTLFHPSDANLKQNIKEVNCAEALSNLSQIRIVRYEIRPEIAEQWGMLDEDRYKVGVIAQEVQQVVPDAVKENGEYLTVDDSRLFYESAAAVKELCRLTGNLEYKIDEVEKISKKLTKMNKLKRFDSFRSSVSSTCSTHKVANVCASYLSCTSLNSTSISNPENDAKKSLKKESNQRKSKSRTQDNHHHHHHMCHFVGEQSLCRNKTIQLTIVLLVLVMAFCLVAMATLYILDWHKRNSSTDNETAKVDSGIQLPPNRVTKVPVIEPGPGKMEVAVPTLPNRRFSNKPHRKFLGPPQLNPCTKPPCEMFCCQSEYPSYLYSLDGSSNASQKFGREDLTIVLKSTPPPIGSNYEKSRSKSNNGLSTEEMADFEYVINDLVSDVMDDLGRNDDSIDVSRSKREVKLNETVEAKNSSQLNVESKWANSTSIKILGVNVTLDERYLSSGVQKKGNFSYQIPVSVHMPYISLEVEFGLDSQEQLMFCSKEAGLVCPGLENSFSNIYGRKKQPKGVHKRDQDRYELPVGFYHYSLYKLRTGASTTLCNLPNDEVGASFLEYNLLFYRVCASKDN